MAVAVAIVFASGLVAYDAVSRRPAVSVAGEAKMQMLRDEHALIADYLSSDAQARKLADAAIDRDIARLRLVAQGEAQQQARMAELEDTKAASKVESKLKTAAPRAAERAAPARLATRDGGEPLQVPPMANVALPPAAAPVQARNADGPVRSRLRELASDVGRIPSLLKSAAGWVVDAVPAPKLPGLPARPFSASI